MFLLVMTLNSGSYAPDSLDCEAWRYVLLAKEGSTADLVNREHR